MCGDCPPAEFSEDVFKRSSCEWDRDCDDLADMLNCTSLVHSCPSHLAGQTH